MLWFCYGFYADFYEMAAIPAKYLNKVSMIQSSKDV